MKVLVRNISRGHLKTPSGDLWHPGGEEVLEIELPLLDQRVRANLYQVIEEIQAAEPAKKRRIVRSRPGKRPTVSGDFE